MDAAKSLLSPFSTFPPRTRLKHSPSSTASSTALVLHEQETQQEAPLRILRQTTVAQHISSPVLVQESQDQSKLMLHITKQNTTSYGASDMGWMEAGEQNETLDSDDYVKEFQLQLLNWPGLWYLFPSLKAGATQSLSSPTVTSDHDSYGTNLENFSTPSLGSTSVADLPVEKEQIVRSTRLLERKSKRRGVSKLKVVVDEEETYGLKRLNVQKNKSRVFDPDDPLRLFLSIPETKQLLTLQEETDLIANIQDLLSLEEVKSKLHTQFGREPALVEWAGAVGLSNQALKSRLRSGNGSRDKLIYANFRMVVHVAKQYQGRGLGFQDLLQEGSVGLMKSVGKFKPEATGGRFANYAYWWIKHAIRTAIFRHSRIIRLPVNIYRQISKVKEAKSLCIEEGNHNPTIRDIAKRAGFTVEKLEELHALTRNPVSLQQQVRADQQTTYEDIIADPTVDTPRETVEKEIMRRHIRGLLNNLSPKERQVMRLRYGIESGEPKSLSEIGLIVGSSKERIRQLEVRALYRLKKCLGSHELGAYTELLF